MLTPTVPGAGLSIEQRKRVTLVELVAKPTLLFLDEPTSGLDGQSAYNIIRFRRKLVDGGQAVLCTIHQPLAVLFEAFDSLLLLARGGKMAYFGETGKDSQTVLDYRDIFEAREKKVPSFSTPNATPVLTSASPKFTTGSPSSTPRPSPKSLT